MALPPLLTRPCYCGTARDGRGMCPHCDKAQPYEHNSGGSCDPCQRVARHTY